MEPLINVSGLQIIDLLLRGAITGQLLLAMIVLTGQRLSEKVATWFLLLCFLAYVLLTAPIHNHHYGWLRPPLLLFTDLTAYALLNFYWLRVHGFGLWKLSHSYVKGLIILWLLWLGIFFIAMEGIGAFHDLHHWIGLCIFLLIIGDAIWGYQDDLVERRRQTRRLVIVALSVYMGLLTALELLDSDIRDNTFFSLTHALLMFLMTGVFLVKSTLFSPGGSYQTSANLSFSQTIPDKVEQSPDERKLIKLLDEGYFEQNDLTIGKMADVLGIPEHQLRVLINKQLGFENFSHFLNSYRIPAVCEKLRDPKRLKEPILTIALDTGFNSIASFNRAFKKQVGMTPTDYRAQFQN